MSGAHLSSPPADRKPIQRLHAALQDAPPPVLSLGGLFGDAFPQGGLAAGAHEMAGAGAAPLGFALALLSLALAAKDGARGLLVQAGEAGRETGLFYGPGLQAMGLDPDRLGVVRVASGAEALRVTDEALRSGAVAAVLADLGNEPRLDLSVTRRFNLSARTARGAALLVIDSLDATSAALTRWRVAPHSSRTARRRLGRPAFRLSLLRNRLGPTGEWTLEWDSDDRLFRPAPPLPAPVVRPPVDRPDPARRSDPLDAAFLR